MSHNIDFEKNAPDFIKERNKKFLEAYANLIEMIDRMQGFLKDEFLRMRVESTMKDKPGIQSTILQCTTAWCVLSLGCDTMGRYNLAYSVDHRLQQMVGDDMATAFIRRIYEFTPGEMAPFVRIGCLYQDCIEVFETLLEEHQTVDFHKIYTRELN